MWVSKYKGQIWRKKDLRKGCFHVNIADTDNANSMCSFFFSDFNGAAWQHNLIIHIFHKPHGKEEYNKEDSESNWNVLPLKMIDAP